MNLTTGLFKSSLGKKFIMAVTGLALFGFVIAHLVGNLQIFLPDHGDALNRYGHFLQSNREIVWPARIGLLVLIFLHIWAAITLTNENRAARPIGYAGNPTPFVASYASRTMMMSGLIIATFVIYHLLHYTAEVKGVNFTGTDFETLHDSHGRHDIYRMMIIGFSNPIVALFYVLGVGLLCLHLSHGVQALFQSLGLKKPHYDPIIKKFARVAAIAIFVGYASIPLAVLTDL